MNNKSASNPFNCNYKTSLCSLLTAGPIVWKMKRHYRENQGGEEYATYNKER